MLGLLVRTRMPFTTDSNCSHSAYRIFRDFAPHNLPMTSDICTVPYNTPAVIHLGTLDLAFAVRHK
jgi:hypothetical protein